jgi:hypothetical protein
MSATYPEQSKIYNPWGDPYEPNARWRHNARANWLPYFLYFIQVAKCRYIRDVAALMEKHHEGLGLPLPPYRVICIWVEHYKNPELSNADIRQWMKNTKALDPVPIIRARETSKWTKITHQLIQEVVEETTARVTAETTERVTTETTERVTAETTVRVERETTERINKAWRERPFHHIQKTEGNTTPKLAGADPKAIQYIGNIPGTRGRLFRAFENLIRFFP